MTQKSNSDIMCIRDCDSRIHNICFAESYRTAPYVKSAVDILWLPLNDLGAAIDSLNFGVDDGMDDLA